MAETFDMRCNGCDLKPEEIYEYIVASGEAQTTPREFVIAEEDTYNPNNGHFFCSSCHVALGMPSGVAK